MQYLQQVGFLILAAYSIWLFAKNMKQIKRNILLGRDENLNDNPSLRWRNVILLALGQKKMFRNPTVAIIHLIIYAGFIIINIEVLEIVLDGILGTHRLFLSPLGNCYSFIINFFEMVVRPSICKVYDPDETPERSMANEFAPDVTLFFCSNITRQATSTIRIVILSFCSVW